MSIYSTTTKRTLMICLIGVAVGFNGQLAQAQQPPVLYNTGQDANHNLLAPGSVDPHYTLISSSDPLFPGPSAYVVQDNGGVPIQPGQWFADGPNSEWIAPQANQNDNGGVGPGSDPAGNYEYQTTFNFTGANPNDLVIHGLEATDDYGLDILVNGQSTGITAYGPGGPPAGAYSAFVPFTLDQYFVTGLNTLDFVVENVNTGGAVNPTGLRVELSAPEPGALALFATSGLSALGLLARRRLRS